MSRRRRSSARPALPPHPLSDPRVAMLRVPILSISKTHHLASKASSRDVSVAIVSRIASRSASIASTLAIDSTETKASHSTSVLVIYVHGMPSAPVTVPEVCTGGTVAIATIGGYQIPIAGILEVSWTIVMLSTCPCSAATPALRADPTLMLPSGGLEPTAFTLSVSTPTRNVSESPTSNMRPARPAPPPKNIPSEAQTGSARISLAPAASTHKCPTRR